MLKTLTLLLSALGLSSNAWADSVYDESRSRTIPIEVTKPKVSCHFKKKCPVAFISAGYGVPHTEYSFLANTLNDMGFLTIAVAHELPSDPPLSVSGNLYETRSENWQRGSETLRVIKSKLAANYSNFDFGNVLLVGHSNGGDISAWLANEKASFVNQVITFDHRRVPLPRNKSIKVLSVRASDFPADKGVLPAEDEVGTQNICVITINNAKHNDMADHGPKWLKDDMTRYTREFLLGKRCDSMSGENVDG